MVLNRLEFLLMNNPLRAFVQKHIEGPRLEAMGGVVRGGCALEVGCGRGVGAEIILDRFGAARVDAVDLDPKMIERAKRRLKDRPARVWVADATHLDAQDETYDAVFDFGIIHHIPDWRRAVGEIWRVLKPDGRFYAEEALREFISQRLCRALFQHPWEDRFDHEDFLAALRLKGFLVVAAKQHWHRFGWYVARKELHGKKAAGQRRTESHRVA